MVHLIIIEASKGRVLKKLKSIAKMNDVDDTWISNCHSLFELNFFG